MDTQKRVHRTPEERRAQILAGAVECILCKGYHAATMDDLARESGLSKGSLYWHFDSKEEVFLALFDDVATATFDAWDAQDSEASAFEHYVNLVTDAFQDSQFMKLRPVWADFFAHPRCRDRLAGLYRDMRTRLVAGLEQERAGKGPEGASSEAAAALLVGAVEGLGIQAMVDASFDLESHWRESVQLLRGGFG